MDQKTVNAKSVLTSSGALLAAQWIIALVSIPSSRDYAAQLANGTKPEDIVTMYDNFSLLLTFTLAWSWFATNRFLIPLYDQAVATNPNSMRLKRGWVFWSWLVPIVSFWFPKRIVDDLLKVKGTNSDQEIAVGKSTNTWWATWISFILVNNLIAINTITGAANPIQPAYEIAAACMLTASYTVWTKIIKSLAE